MKKMIICVILLLSIIGMVGCSSKDITITASEITNDTFVARANGIIQVATVEDFDKEYYVLNELHEFVAGNIKEYNKKVGEDKIVIDEIEKKDNSVVMLLTYSGMDQYCTFNQAKGAYFTGGNKEISFTMPETLIAKKDGKASNTTDIIKNEKYKVLVLFEPYDIIVDGKVMYYSDNMLLVEDGKIQSAETGMSMVVYKP